MILVEDPQRRGAYFIRVGGTDQSYVDPDDPLLLEFDYVQRMADVLDAHAPEGERLRVVHVGGAGMTLPRYVVATRPTSPQIVLEPDEELTLAVRDAVPLPRRSGIKVRAQDGVSGIAAMPDDYADIVIVDAFAGARVPPELTTLEFLTDAQRVLAPHGTFMINITDRAPFAYGRRVLAGVRSLFPEVLLSAEPATLKGRMFGNVLIVGGTDLPIGILQRRAASSAFPYRVVTGPHLDQLMAGARPFSGSDADRSPEPPQSLFHTD